MKTLPLHRATFTRPIALATLALTLVAGGCDKPTPGEQAMQTAGGAVSRVSHGVREDGRTDTYDKVVSSLSPALGEEQTSAPASALAGRAKFGIADETASEYTEVVAVVYAGIAEVAEYAGRWRIARAEAEAFAAFDASADRQRINQEIRRIDADLGSNAAKRGEIQRRIDELRQQSSRAASSESALRLKIAELDRRRASVSAIEGEVIAQEAYAIQREADTLATEAGRLDALIASISPQLGEFDLRATMFSTQKDKLAKSLLLLGEREASAKASAASANDRANQVANDLIQRADRLDGEAAAASDLFTRAKDAYSSANSALSRASGAVAAQGKVIRVECESAVSGLDKTQRELLGAYADAVGQIVTIESALRGSTASRFAERAEAARAAAKALEPEAPAEQPVEEPPAEEAPEEEPAPAGEA